LVKYQKYRRVLPKRIIFYRDGVSEGQFKKVLDEERPRIAEAYKSFGTNFKPTITIIVVVKRHHVR
ncbi:Piwi domain-containing protein, partial [Cyathus striatus]